MAETRTARMGMPQWGATSDGPSMDDFNEAFLRVEERSARYAQGTRGARPATGVPGRFYEVVGDATPGNNGMVFYDTGSAWVNVGAVAEDSISRASAPGTVGLRVDGAASQTADLQQWRSSAGAVLTSINPDGGLRQSSIGQSSFGGAVLTGARVGIHQASATAVGLALQAFSSGTANLQEWRDNGGGVLGSVSRTGALTVPSLTITGGQTIGSTSSSKSQTITATAAGTIGLIVAGVASQTADLQQWRNSAAVVMGSMTAAGVLSAKQFNHEGYTAGDTSTFGTFGSAVTATGSQLWRVGRGEFGSVGAHAVLRNVAGGALQLGAGPVTVSDAGRITAPDGVVSGTTLKGSVGAAFQGLNAGSSSETTAPGGNVFVQHGLGSVPTVAYATATGPGQRDLKFLPAESTATTLAFEVQDKDGNTLGGGQTLPIRWFALLL